ncbi:hypothetical protein BFP72_02400 [Reichenbachiella sp. 5M10]|uniref:nuclear transport factor 2 family protein n=1 Tax=Reichenbachiella sp. 5M10 TaxID=1889772 RepID=UPI000C14F062|nr:nuclear transport factor 2 family protein [Reichenbachiella sp. 5M10]PIB34352.1 hypothetical protein BFP72_02400 [Reichenbachiella sp. 5M10]
MKEAHIELIERFYTAFANKDVEAMLACYHSEVLFQDPVFGHLDHAHVSGMWRMLLQSGVDLKINHDRVHADEEKGGAHWDAVYRFSKTGRLVHNKIEATFGFRDGLIVSHVDRFDLYKWTQMAFGPLGFSIGWTPYFKKKLRAQVRKSLVDFMNLSK